MYGIIFSVLNISDIASRDLPGQDRHAMLKIICLDNLKQSLKPQINISSDNTFSNNWQLISQNHRG